MRWALKIKGRPELARRVLGPRATPDEIHAFQGRVSWWESKGLAPLREDLTAIVEQIVEPGEVATVVRWLLEGGTRPDVVVAAMGVAPGPVDLDDAHDPRSEETVAKRAEAGEAPAMKNPKLLENILLAFKCGQLDVSTAATTIRGLFQAGACTVAVAVGLGTAEPSPEMQRPRKHRASGAACLNGKEG